MKILLPQQVQQIIETLEAAGYEAYAVGGCVRDRLLGREPNDWDITTSATPQQVKALFRRTVDTGIAHGTVSVLLPGGQYEVTTYRIDGEYTDSRHPASVVFTDSLTEDLRRRDFTINAMAYNETRGLVDVFGGISDLENKIVRCVGDARERFGEDALRMLRAVRFAAQLGFTVEESTQDAIREMAGSLEHISAERIQTELVKLLVSPHPEELVRAYELGMTAVFLPEFDTMMRTGQNNPHHCYSVGMHTVRAIQECRADRVTRLSALLHDVGKPAVKTTDDGVDHFKGHPQESERLAHDVLRRLKFDNDTVHKVCLLVLLHDDYPRVKGENLVRLQAGENIAEKRMVRRMARRAGKELFEPLMDLMRADVLAQSEYRRTEKLLLIDQICAAYREIERENDCISLSDLAVNGSDLISAGMEPGKEIGEMLNRMLEDVMDHPEHNTKEYLLGFCRS